ncbi:MAG TPA: VanW family protein [Polyangiaceae bacterium]|nr:VanW family protein [Polyangiaceae bacterium]HOT12858.1 VanW family protein [Polyangiaceae bacterium]HPY17215.1 VanW family protein [Polyangiaceae bacterium]HQF24446.1 VanW family protein [Polyangiaceae bacterium]HQM09678.1 VanW family protein [Polyangiaceae bacterium]
MPPPHSRKTPWLRVCLWLGLLAFLFTGVSLVAIAFVVLPAEGCPAHGLFVGSHLPPSDPPFGSWLEQRRQRLSQEPVLLVYGMDSYETTLGELGIEVDVAATMADALRFGREPSVAQRARTLYLARNSLIDVPLSYSMDMRRAQITLRPFAQQVRRAPVNAYVNLTEHARIADIPGAELDLEATAASMMQGVLAGERAFLVHTRPIRAQVTEADLMAVDVTRVVSTFETRFTTWGEGHGRSRNIELAAGSIDGMVLMPGQSFSFNEVVGRRSLEAGYVWAPVIVGDEMRPGVGGGICQVASTLYASALLGALQITERWAHGRPSSYTRMGLDATVAYPSKDLRFVNSLPYPVILHLHFPEKGVLRAEILGGEPIAKVRYSYGVSRTMPFVRRIVSVSSLAPGTAKRKQKGIQGYSVVSVVELDFGSRVDKRVYHSEYRPTPEIFWVSPDYDLSALPELPKGAKGIEEKITEAEQEYDPTG